MTGGWVPFQADWWPTVAAALPLPWPREAVLFDLRWWQDQASFNGTKRPGRPALAARWGWKDWDTRAIMREESVWGDPTKSIPPAALQPSSSGTPTALQESAGESAAVRVPPPAVLQPPSSGTPELLPTRVVVHPTPTHSPSPVEQEHTKPKRSTKKPKHTGPETDDERKVAHTYASVFNGDQPTKPEWEGIRRWLPSKGLLGIQVYIVGLAQSPAMSWWREKGLVQKETVWRDKHFEGLFREVMKGGAQGVLPKGGSYERRADDQLPLGAVPIEDDGKEIDW